MCYTQIAANGSYLLLGLFAGKRWEVISVSDEKKLISLNKAKGGKPPQFGGEGLSIHDIVRKEMRRVYNEQAIPIYLNHDAKSLLQEGFENYRKLDFEKVLALQRGNTVHVFTWLGDKAANTISLLLIERGLSANNYHGVIDIQNASTDDFYQAVDDIFSGPKVDPTDLAGIVPNTIIEKHDNLLSENIRNIGYGANHFDVEGALKFLSSLNH